MLNVRYSQSFIPSVAPRPRVARATRPAKATPKRLHCRAESEPSLEERALRSPDAGMRHWGIAQLVRARPGDGGADARRCSVLGRFVRTTGAADQQALLDAVDLYGATPRMLPVIHELMSSRFVSVRSRTAPLWGALMGLYKLSDGARDDTML